MLWVYDRTGSLLVAMLMHVSLVASNTILVQQRAEAKGGVLALLYAPNFGEHDF